LAEAIINSDDLSVVVDVTDLGPALVNRTATLTFGAASDQYVIIDDD
jgi:hypothetical protein